MSRITFYRKYRSKIFAEIVGQEHIIQTLTNAIAYDRLTHAYIFSGPRGTGKTSTARILAKAINCRTGKSATPCLACDICQKISKSLAIDVIEIDAASNTGVDNIRSLNEQVNFAPVECLYKIYIIDEAHMLSIGAFNALLKTLEEPPKNTIFILATTEPQKIPVTIHSRCQTLHFRRLTNKELSSQLRMIATNEGLEISDKSLLIIAKNANGGMRDAISLLDQIYAFKGNKITQEDVLLILGTANWDSLYELVELIFASQSKEIIITLQSIIDEGLNPVNLTTNLTEIFHQLLFVKMNLAEELDLDDTKIEHLKKLVKNYDFGQIKYVLEEFSRLEGEMRYFPNPELLLQIKCLSVLSEKSCATVVAKEEKINPINSLDLKIESKPIASPIINVISKTEWDQVLDIIKTKNPVLFNFILKDSVAKVVSDNSIKIGLKQYYAIHKDHIIKNKNFLEETIKEVFKKSLKLEISEPESPKTVTNINQNQVQTESRNPIAEKISNHIPDEKSKKINQIIELFEGVIV